MSEALARQQSLLLQSVLGTTSADAALRAELNEPLAARGLQAYRANGQALAERALRAAFPVVAQMMGEESFTPLAHYFWCQHPPQRGDMGQWGGDLANFLDAAPQLADAPYFGDVARVEWALHCTANAADTEPDPASFALLAEAIEASLTLSPGVFMLASAYPVVSLINAHLSGKPCLADAFDLLQSGACEHAVVWRQGFKPCCRPSNAFEYALLQAVQSGLPLDQALSLASQTADSAANRDFNFSNWLTESVQQGLVTGAKRVTV